MSRLIDLTGQRFTKLKVIERGPDLLVGKNRLQWICKCDCGNIVNVRSSNLKSSATKSCGCLAKLPEGEASFNRLYGVYKRNARVRNYTFSLTKDEFRSIILKECYYCGKEPSMIQKATIRNNGDFVYNGVDRLNNDLGYEIENCVAACKFCNLAKGTKSIEEFLGWVGRVYENNE